MPGLIVQSGTVNTAALQTPQLLVQIVPPQVLINGVSTNVLGIVGTANWGPVNVSTIVATSADYKVQFGTVQNRKYDLGTQVATAVLQGASAFRCVRVTDGTDLAASAGINQVSPSNRSLLLSARYTGSLGNTLTWSLTAGSAAGSWRLTIALPGVLVETFDNITGTGAAFWTNLASAVNNGTGVTRGPSQIVTAGAPAGANAATAPAVASGTFSGGTDGATTITAATLVGVDTVPRTGMYALRGQGCSIAVLADADDSTIWTTVDVFGQGEGIYMIQTLPAGTLPAAAVTAKQTAGLDSYASKLMHGDWVYWFDSTNNVLRLVSPQGFAAGRLANLGPHQSGLNKPLNGVVGTQKSGTVGSSQVQSYSQAETDVLFGNGIDCIINPCPGGYYWGMGAGRNASSNASVHGDNYTRMTNFIAATIARGVGLYVGRLQTATERLQAKTTLDSFFDALWTQGMIGTADGLTIPYRTVLDGTNNPQTRVALGYQQADIQVIYLSVVEYFIANVEGGQSVTIRRLSTQPNA